MFGRKTKIKIIVANNTCSVHTDVIGRVVVRWLGCAEQTRHGVALATMGQLGQA